MSVPLTNHIFRDKKTPANTGVNFLIIFLKPEADT